MEKLLARVGTPSLLRQEFYASVDINLRGIGQVMFQNNPLTGALFLAAVGWGSYAAGVPQVCNRGLVAVVAATLTAQWLRVDEAWSRLRSVWL